MRTKITPQKLARIDAWYAVWKLKRKTVAAQLGISTTTLMNVAKRDTSWYGRLRGG